jgi:hypothetical protein
VGKFVDGSYTPRKLLKNIYMGKILKKSRKYAIFCPVGSMDAN